MDKFPFWYGKVAGMTNLLEYDNYNLWTKYKNSYLNVQKEPPKSENWKWCNPWKKGTLLNKMHIYSAFPLRALQAAQLLVAWGVRKQNSSLAERLKIEEEIPERRDHSGRIQKSTCKICSNNRLTSELHICVGNSEEPSKKDKAITGRLKTLRRNFSCSSPQGRHGLKYESHQI